MSAALHNATVIKDEDQVGVANGAQSVGDDDLGAGEGVEILLDGVLGFDVKGTGGLVQ